ncbi:MAG TPA: hypothetical protein PLN85_02950 [archaeon]|nr:hypothetical protein [archaeon]
MSEKLLCHIQNLNFDNNTILLQFSFLNLNQIELLQQLNDSKQFFTISIFNIKSKNLKTYKQLKTYFMLLKQILSKSDIPITKDNIQSLDRYIMENLFPCATLELNGQTIKCPPSKRFLSIDDFNELLKIVLDTFSYLDIKIENL